MKGTLFGTRSTKNFVLNLDLPKLQRWYLPELQNLVIPKLLM
jgi:hypothetical protein